MKLISADELHAHKVAELGLDSTILDLSSIEAIAGALRRAAAFLCPCSARTLARAVRRSLDGLVSNVDEVGSVVKETIEALARIIHQGAIGGRQSA